MRHAVAIDGRCMKYASEDVKDNRMIGLEAVQCKGSAIKYLSLRLQRDPEVKKKKNLKI
jgi:hypothetical protein